MHGLLISQMDPPAELDDEFHDWYDTEHIPVRLALPGFASAIRYQSTGDATRFLVCYFIDDMDVLDSAEYHRIKTEPGPRTERMLGAVRDFTRFTCSLVDDTGDRPSADQLVVHVAQCAPGDADEFERQCASLSRHLVDSESTWRRVRSYRARGVSAGGTWTHISLHELSAPMSGPPPFLGSSAATKESWWDYRVIRRTP